MSHAIQAIRGMNDLLPDVVPAWQRFESAARSILHAYGYAEIRLPLIEKTELFARSIGDVTDIVEKEMYTFEDRNGDSLTLRPEGTAGCVRAGIEHGLLHNQVQRFWYQGPMFRHERPQKGRYRQFHQLGVEAFGMPGPDIDVELILMCARLWKALGVDGLELQINSLGTPAVRQHYRHQLVGYLESRRGDLDEDSLRRVDKNPLRVLDSKNPEMQAVIAGAPSMLDALDPESRAHFAWIQEALQGQGVAFRVNPRLVRGLDYYSRTVFEWTTTRLGAQSAVCAGGRFDALVEHLGGRPMPAAGFAIGLERLIELMLHEGLGQTHSSPHVYLAVLDETLASDALKLAETLRDAGLRVQVNCGGGALKSQLKRADRSQARFCLMLGGEDARQQLTFKDLRNGEQQKMDAGRAIEYLASHAV